MNESSSDRQLLERAAFKQWAEDRSNDMAGTYDTERSRWVWLSPMTADLWEAWTASRQKALQEAAELCEERRDLREEARAALRASDAMRAGDAEEFMRRMRHEADVRLFNSALDKAASAIRSLGGITSNEGERG